LQNSIEYFKILEKAFKVEKNRFLGRGLNPHRLNVVPPRASKPIFVHFSTIFLKTMKKKFEKAVPARFKRVKKQVKPTQNAGTMEKGSYKRDSALSEGVITGFYCIILHPNKIKK